MNQTQYRSNQEYSPAPNPDAEAIFKQVVSAGVPRFIAQPAIIKHEMELSSRRAYA